MKRYDYFEPIVGDDEPYWTLRYRDVPEPFRLRDAWVVMTDTLPLVQSKKDSFIAAFDAHYGRYEINAETYQDFLDMLQEVLLINADTVERLLEVYDTDIAKPILGREETRTLTTTEEGIADASTEETRTRATTEEGAVDAIKEETRALATTEEGTTDGTSANIDIPADNPLDDKPTSRGRTGQTSNTGRDENETSNGTTGETSNVVRDESETSRGITGQTSNVVRDEIETTKLSDLGVRPNYETLNGFLDNNRTAYTVFNGLFKNCFLNAIPWYVM